jgi:hypothetical protein
MQFASSGVIQHEHENPIEDCQLVMGVHAAHELVA